jgi:hypothetical protein
VRFNNRDLHFESSITRFPMTALKLEMSETCATYRPVGVVTLEEGIGLVSQAILHCVQNKIHRVLIDTTGLSGFTTPDTMDRYTMGEEWALAAAGSVTIALVARAELIDSRRFGLIVARNRGLSGEVFTSETDAIAWLLKQGQPCDR